MAIFNVVLIKTSIMMVLMAIGYFFGRRKIVSENAGRDIAVLTTRFLLPVYIFNTVVNHVSPDSMSQNMTYFLLGIAFLVVSLALSFVISKLLPDTPINRLITYYILTFPNISYFGYPNIESAFGSEVISQFIIFSLPSVLTLNTYGTYLLTSKRSSINDNIESRFNVKQLRALPFELLTAVVLGIVIGLLRIPLPSPVKTFLDFTSVCMSPISMILAGLILSIHPLSALFRAWRPYVISTLKIFIVPLIIGTIAYAVGLRGYNLIFPVAISCMPVGMNAVIFSRPEYSDYADTTVVCFISYIFGLLGIPLMIALVTALA